MEIVKLKRVFKYKGQDLRDLDPTLTPQQVMKLYTDQFPELLNATLTGPAIKDDVETYTFGATFGTKG